MTKEVYGGLEVVSLMEGQIVDVGTTERPQGILSYKIV